MILPVPVTLNRFLAALLVFCFGISFRSCVFRRAQHHHHVATVEKRLRLDLPNLLHVLGEPEEEVSTTLRMGRLATAEHDRYLDLRALVQEPLYVTLLGVVVVDTDLRTELDLLDLDLALMLPSLLPLLLLLVPVLAVVHDLRDRRVRLGGHLDQVEVLPVGVFASLVGGLDPELRAVVVDEPDLRDANRIVDASRVAVVGTLLLDRPASGPQRQITKLGLLLLDSLAKNSKTGCMQRPVPTESFDSVEPREACARE